MRSPYLMLLLAGLLLGFNAPKSDAGSDTEKIQGTWKVASAQDSGRKTPAEAIENLEWVITRDKITYKFGDKTTEWSYRLGPTNKPKWIDLTHGERTMLGIYHLDGDKLKICYPEGREGERSTAFESKPESVNDVLVVLKRKEP